MEDSHCKTSEEVLKYFNTNEELGLTPDQVKQYQAKYGPNGESAHDILINLFICVTLFHPNNPVVNS
jgi:Ca2+ transporting ATPase